MGSMSIWHWLIVVLVVVLIFGTGKLKNAGRDLGNAVKGFREGIKEGEKETVEAKKEEAPTPVEKTVTEAPAATVPVAPAPAPTEPSAAAPPDITQWFEQREIDL